ncbi:MAG: c-type cytochrome, partial [Mucilaginibacter sp.]
KSGSGSATDSTSTATSPATTAVDSTGGAAASPGAQLIAKYDCLGCHKEHEKLIGPAYADVAAKYTSSPAVIDTLANKVINGGKGNWGDVPMSGHPSISMDDARSMVKYILSLKK